MLIETRRLILRAPIVEDISSWPLMGDDESVTANSGSNEDQRRSWNEMFSIAGHWSLMGWGPLCAVEKQSGALVGRFGPSKPFGWPCVEIGWMLLPHFQGKGYALEAAAAAMDFALLERGEARVIHTIRPANVASQRLARTLGSINRGPITLPAPYEHHSNDEWTQTREHWIENRTRLAITS
ncbi:MAG: GNAT family N-acetyltransferase [Hyphomonadaceae bacterium]